MVWHIFRKDCRLLWKWIVLVALMQAANAALAATLGLQGVGLFELGIYVIPLLGPVALAAAVVQQDALTDIRQDWHVRPIRRRDLVFAKILFVLLMGHGPLFLADFSVGLILGEPVLRSAGVAALRALAIFCIFSLPGVVLATLTRTVLSVMGAWFALMLGLTVMAAVTKRGLSLASHLGYIVETMPRDGGLSWMNVWVAAVIVLLTAAAVLPLRYIRRSTTGALGIIVGAVLLGTIVSQTLWRPAFAIQQRLSPMPEMASPISMAFDPAAKEWDSGWTVRPANKDVHIDLPVRVLGLPDDVLIIQEKAVIQLLAVDGTRLLTRQTDHPSTLRLSTQDQLKAVHTVHPIVVPAELYTRIKNEPVRVEIDYALTLFELDSTHTLAFSDIPQQVGDLGRCTARRASGAHLDVRCTSLGRSPYCIQGLLERDPETSHRTRFYMSCTPSYAPVRMSVFPGVLQQFGHSMGIFEHDMVGSNGFVFKPPGSVRTFELEAYAPRVHFTRTLTTPSIRLEDLLLTRTR